MSSEQPRAIIFNCNFNGLSIIQDLGLRGIACTAMDVRRSIGTFSRYATYVNCPDPAERETDFIDFLYAYCDKQAVKPVLFPTNDHWATAISKHKNRLSKVAHSCVADWSAVDLVIDKERFYELGQKKAYMTPETWQKADLGALAEEHFPIVAKPVARRNSADKNQEALFEAMDRLRLSVLANQQELSDFIAKEHDWLEQLVFQRYVPGLSDEMYTVGVYADAQHELKAIFSGKKVRGYPADIGDCIVGEVRGVPAALIDNAQKISRDIGLSGIAEFEYKRDVVKDSYVLIEINPRSWSWIGITPACGVSLPHIAYQDLMGFAYEVSQVAIPDGSVRYVKILQDFLNVVFRYKLEHPAWSASVSEWFKELRQQKTVMAEFHARDYLVALISLAQTLKLGLTWLIKRYRKRA